ncbi:hypothetical protein ACFQFH_08985 [Halobaculum halobium]|uniref:hypothetical protein n=1 Tax=Halobaculum halobium TaxID=3032281 RepID=UPI0036235E73
MADAADTSVQNVRHHVSKLVDTGLVEATDTRYSVKGREMTVYGPADDRVVVAVGGVRALFAPGLPARAGRRRRGARGREPPRAVAVRRRGGNPLRSGDGAADRRRRRGNRRRDPGDGLPGRGVPRRRTARPRHARGRRSRSNAVTDGGSNGSTDRGRHRRRERRRRPRGRGRDPRQRRRRRRQFGPAVRRCRPVLRRRHRRGRSGVVRSRSDRPGAGRAGSGRVGRRRPGRRRGSRRRHRERLRRRGRYRRPGGRPGARDEFAVRPDGGRPRRGQPRRDRRERRRTARPRVVAVSRFGRPRTDAGGVRTRGGLARRARRRRDRRCGELLPADRRRNGPDRTGSRARGRRRHRLRHLRRKHRTAPLGRLGGRIGLAGVRRRRHAGEPPRGRADFRRRDAAAILGRDGRLRPVPVPRRGRRSRRGRREVDPRVGSGGGDRRGGSPRLLLRRR